MRKLTERILGITVLLTLSLIILFPAPGFAAEKNQKHSISILNTSKAVFSTKQEYKLYKTSDLVINSDGQIVGPEVGALSTGLGLVTCSAYGMEILCDWSFTLSGGDLINYSNIILYYKWYNDGSYVSKGSQKFSYPVNPAVKTIYNQGEKTMTSKGRYKMTLGGTVTGRQAVYGAVASGGEYVNLPGGAAISSAQ